VGCGRRVGLMKRENDSQARPDVVLYPLPDGASALRVRLDRETVWLDAHQLARLFGRDRSVVVRHVRNVFKTKELDRKTTCARTAQIAADGRRRLMDLYSLDVIIAVGYRVNSSGQW
jgi:hypothetical protein